MVYLAREGELSLRGYKPKVQTSRLQIVKYKKTIKDQDVFMAEKYVKILNLEGKLINKVEKLRKVDTYGFEKREVAKHFEQVAKEAKEKVFALQDQLGAMSSQVNSFSTMVDTLKAEFTKSYQNGVSFMMSSLRTQS